MAGDDGLKSLAARRHALVAESEVYRQTLKLEVQNMRLYVARMQRGFRVAQAVKPLLFLLPLAGSLFGSRPKAKGPPPASRWRRVLGSVVLGWRLYGKFKPFLDTMSFFRRRRSQSTGQKVYLS